MASQKTITHIFGELQLDLTQNSDQVYKASFRISEDCGYMPIWSTDKKCLTVTGPDMDVVKIFFEEDRVSKVKKSIDEGKTWENLNFKDGIFDVSDDVLKKYNAKIKYFGSNDKLENIPFSQGSLIKKLIDTYKIPAIRIGYHQDHIGIETKAQFILWRDCGTHAEFMGLINKKGDS